MADVQVNMTGQRKSVSKFRIQIAQKAYAYPTMLGVYVRYFDVFKSKKLS